MHHESRHPSSRRARRNAPLFLVTTLALAMLQHACDEERTATLAASELRAVDLDGRTVAAFADDSTRFVALIFTSTDCPISNRYAPEVRRLHDRFAPLGVEFLLVYADPAEPLADIRAHIEAFGYPCRTARDVGQRLVHLTGVKVTPEVAVVDRAGRLLYRGRIDDRFPGYGMARLQPHHRDLEDALNAVTTGASVPTPRTDAVGCFIPDRRSAGNES